MANPYTKYYLDQAGSGLAGFEGYRFQKGSGFLGRMIKSFAKPLLSYLGLKAFRTGRNIVDDVISGKNLKESGRQRLRQALSEVGDDAEAKISQRGHGYTPRQLTRKTARTPVRRKPPAKRRAPRKATKAAPKRRKPRKSIKAKPVRKKSTVPRQAPRRNIRRSLSFLN